MRRFARQKWAVLQFLCNALRRVELILFLATELLEKETGVVYLRTSHRLP